MSVTVADLRGIENLQWAAARGLEALPVQPGTKPIYENLTKAIFSLASLRLDMERGARAWAADLVRDADLGQRITAAAEQHVNDGTWTPAARIVDAYLMERAEDQPTGDYRAALEAAVDERLRSEIATMRRAVRAPGIAGEMAAQPVWAGVSR